MADAKNDALKNKLAPRAQAGGPVTLHQMKDKMIPQFMMLLNGDQGKAERAWRILQTEYNKPKSSLPNCSLPSVLGSVINAVQIGLEPGPLGHAYLVPFKGECTLQIGYRGMLELVMRSGKVDSVYAYPVYKGDKFKYSLGTGVSIIHEPADDVEPIEANISHFYAVAIIKGSSIPRVEVMTKTQVDAIRKRAQAGGNGPWQTDYAEMGRKTILKRIAKTLPLSIETQAAIAKDETVRKNITKVDELEMDDSTPIYNMIEAAPSSKIEEPKAETEVNTETGEVADGEDLYK